MAGHSSYPYQANPATKDPIWLKYLLIFLALGFVGIMLIVPLIAVFYEAFREGVLAYKNALIDPEALHAIKLTLLTSAIILPINTIIGVAIAWLVTRHKFKGKFLITTLLDLPFAVSPVVAGLMFILIFGTNSIIGQWFESLGIHIIFAVPGIVLATLFVTFPFIARELI
ncbi:MAG: sulfate ABC transporter permease subunit CysW, partial [Moraxella sp.]|nr:sulfate ABC transporter permease subunit CysW [Moraxella sp.]